MRPIKGISDNNGIVITGNKEITPALLNPSPNTKLIPVPKKVRANPLTTWSACKVMVIKA